MVQIYEKNTGASPVRSRADVDMTRCRAEVHYYMGGWPHWKQCERKGVVEHNGMMFCRQHSPEAEAKRRAAADEKYRQERLRWDRKDWERGALTVVRQIADGHNDPMTLAREYMAKEPK